MANRNRALRLSIRWKFVIPFALIVFLVVAVLLPIVSELVSRRIAAAADERLSETAASVAVVMEQSKRQAR